MTDTPQEHDESSTDHQQLQSHIEAILFVESKAISYKQLSRVLEVDAAIVQALVKELSQQYSDQNRGLRVLFTDKDVQLVTAPELHDVVAKVIKDERTGELTKPSLETLSIIAYRSPTTKAELEMIRGVNCTMILRNLLIRGLIYEQMSQELGVEVYDVTPEYLQLLGVNSVQELPNYETLNRDLTLQETLGQMEGPDGDFFQADSTTANQPNITEDDSAK